MLRKRAIWRNAIMIKECVKLSDNVVWFKRIQVYCLRHLYQLTSCGCICFCKQRIHNDHRINNWNILDISSTEIEWLHFEWIIEHWIHKINWHWNDDFECLVYDWTLRNNILLRQSQSLPIWFLDSEMDSYSVTHDFRRFVCLPIDRFLICRLSSNRMPNHTKTICCTLSIRQCAQRTYLKMELALIWYDRHIFVQINYRFWFNTMELVFWCKIRIARTVSIQNHHIWLGNLSSTQLIESKTQLDAYVKYSNRSFVSHYLTFDLYKKGGFRL